VSIDRCCDKGVGPAVMGSTILLLSLLMLFVTTDNTSCDTCEDFCVSSLWRKEESTG